VGARKSSEVARAVALVTTGKRTVYAAAMFVGVSASSIYRDPAYLAWRKAQAGK
jgi:hypothetical protein